MSVQDDSTQEMEQVAAVLSAALRDAGHRSEAAAETPGAATWATLFGRGALAFRFDRDIYENLLTKYTQGSAPSFDDFAHHPEVEALGDLFRVRPAFFPARLAQAQAEPEAESLTTDLVQTWRERVTRQPADLPLLLPHLISAQPDEAKKLVDRMTQDNLRAQPPDLDAAERLLGLLDSVRLRASNAVAEVLDGAARKVAARKLFLSDEHKSSHYYPRPELHKAMNAFIHGIDDAWILPLDALGGTGKTMFLRHLIAREWVPAGRLVAKVDFDLVGYHNLRQHPWLILLAFAGQLQFQVEPGRFDFFTVEINSYKGYLRAGGPTLSEIRSSEETLLLAQKFAGALGDDPVILVLDTTEEPYLHGGAPFAALLALLREVRERSPGLRVILSGRYDLFGLRGAGGLPRVPELSPFASQCAPRLHIAGFTLDETTAVLEDKWGLRNLKDGVIKAVFEKCVAESEGQAGQRASEPRALPFYVGFWARDLLDKPDPDADEIRAKPGYGLQYLIERVLERIPNAQEELRWLVRYGVIPRRLTPAFMEEVLLPTVRSQRALEAGATERADNPNAQLQPFRGHRKALYSEGVATGKDAATLWNELQTYAAGPEEGWLNAEAAGEALTFHPNVVGTMRRLVRSERIWQDLQRGAREYFELLAKAFASGSGEWTAAMQDVLFHALHESAKESEARWQKCLAELGAGRWEEAVQLANVVLGELAAGEEDGEFFAPQDGRDGPRISPELARAAVAVRCRAALWQAAGKEVMAEAERAATTALEDFRRWPGALLIAGEWVPPLVQAAAVSDRLAEWAPSAGMMSVGDGDLGRLLWSRAHEQAGQSAAALEAYEKFQLGLRRSNAPFSLRRARLIQARALLRLCADPAQAWSSLAPLLRMKGWTAEEKAELDLAASKLHHRMGQPKRAMKWVEPLLMNSEAPEEALEARQLRAALLLELGYPDVALAGVEVSPESADTLPVPSAPSEVLQRVLAGQARAALRVFSADAEMTPDELHSLGLPQEGEALRLAQAETALHEIGNLLLCEALSTSKVEGRLTIRQRFQWGLLAYQVKIFRGVGSRESALEFVTAARDLLGRTLRAEERAETLAALVALGHAEVDELLRTLGEVERPTARLAPLAVLRHAPSGAPRELQRNVRAIFGAALELDDLVLSGAPVDHGSERRDASPVFGRVVRRGVRAGLWLADFYRVWGSREAAAECIERVALEARRNRSWWLWREAALAADRLGIAPAVPPPRTSSLAEKELVFAVQAEELIRAFGRMHAKRQAGQLEKLESQLQSFADAADRAALRQTALYPKLLEAAALARARVPGNRHLLIWRVTTAARRWRELGHEASAGALERLVAEMFPPDAASVGMDKNVPWAQRPGLPRLEIVERAATPDEAVIVATFEHRPGTERHKWDVNPSLARWFRQPRHISYLDHLHTAWAEKESRFLESVAAILKPGLDYAARARSESASEFTEHRPIQLVVSSPGLAAVPWEAALAVRGDARFSLIRTGPADEARRAVVVWVQSALNGLASAFGLPSLQADGIAGNVTTAVLEQLATALGAPLPTAIPSALALIRGAEKAQLPNSTAAVLSLRDESQDRWSGHQRPAYGDHRNLRLIVARPPTVRRGVAGQPLRAWYSTEVPPGLLHIACPLMAASNSGETVLRCEAMSLSVPAFVEALLVGARGQPVVLLDVPLSGNDYRDKEAVLRRNDFAARLFATMQVSAVIAAASDPNSPTQSQGSTSAPVRLYAERELALARLAAERASIADAAAELDRHARPEFATALWAHHPELPFLP